MLEAFDLGDAVLIVIAAMRADRTIRPADSLKRLPGLVRVVEDGILEIGFHGLSRYYQ